MTPERLEQMLQAAWAAKELRRLDIRYAELRQLYGEREARLIWAQAHVLLATEQVEQVDDAIQTAIWQRRSEMGAQASVSWAAVSDWAEGESA